jgi:hemolysin activation/secretion protein
MPSTARRFLGAGAATMLMSSAGFAQTLPPASDPGVIGNQVLNREGKQTRAADPAARAGGPAVVAPERPPVAPLAASAVRFRLTEVQFGASHFLTRDALDKIARPYLGTEVTVTELGAIVAAVNTLYDKRGLVTARALLAPQPIVGGIVKIALIEGRVGRVAVQGAHATSSDAAIARAGLVSGETIDVAALRHRLSLLNRTTDVQTRIALQPGEKFGLTDIQLSVTEPSRNALQLIGDNYGYESAGRWEGEVYYRRTGLVGATDRFTGYASKSSGAFSGTVSYDAPLLGPTSRLGVSYGRSHTEIVSGPFAELNSIGKTESYSANYVQPIASSEYGVLLGSLSAGVSNTRNYISGKYLGNSRTHHGGAGLTYNFAAPGTSFGITVNGIYANAPLGGRPAKGDFGVFSGTMSGEHLFNSFIGVRMLGAWQIATASGVPGDQLFQIGGATTVRGYRQGELTGDGGYFLNAEVEFIPARNPDNLTLFGFFDQGRIFTILVQPKQIAAAGVGASVNIGAHISARLTTAYPLTRITGEKRAPQVFLRVGLAL